MFGVSCPWHSASSDSNVDSTVKLKNLDGISLSASHIFKERKANKWWELSLELSPLTWQELWSRVPTQLIGCEPSSLGSDLAMAMAIEGRGLRVGPDLSWRLFSECRHLLACLPHSPPSSASHTLAVALGGLRNRSLCSVQREGWSVREGCPDLRPASRESAHAGVWVCSVISPMSLSRSLEFSAPVFWTLSFYRILS